MTHVLSRLRTTEGEVTIPHFYDAVRPPTASERDALESVPNVDARLKAELGLARTEGQGALAERIMKPGLNVDRIEGGGTGPNPANAIPSSATAYLDFRLVPDLTPELVKAQLERYLRELGYYVLDGPPAASDRVAHPKPSFARSGPSRGATWCCYLRWGAAHRHTCLNNTSGGRSSAFPSPITTTTNTPRTKI